MMDIATIKIRFTSKSGECSPEIEQAITELERTIDYHAEELAEKFGISYERDWE